MNPTTYWPDKSLPGEIYCEPEVLKRLQMLATDGLLALPRIGLGVGGLLLGRRAAGRIDILKAVEIPCSHTFGPAFVLTPDEIEAASGLRTPEPEAGSEANDDASADCEVVGWYCSKPTWPQDMKGAPTDHDNALFQVFCPEPWQALLLIRPSKGQGTMAVFGFRKPGRPGNGLALGTPRDLANMPAPPEPVEEPEEAFHEAPPVDELATLRVTAAVAPSIVHPPVVSVPVAWAGTLFGVPPGMPGPEEEETEDRKWPRLVLVVVIFLAILAAVAFFTRGYWLPRPPLGMLAISDWTGRVSFMWNSEALRERSQAALIIDDGPGPLRTIHLTEKELRSGFFQLECRPGSATGTLLAGDVSGSIPVTVKAETYLPASGISK